MKLLRVLGCAIAAAVIVGCQGASTTFDRLGATPSMLLRSESLTSHAATQQSVIWTIVDDEVLGYSLAGQQVAGLGSFPQPPMGLCTDPSGDLYVPDAAHVIYAYAPGQSNPYYVYDDLGENPISCAFDPTTGNLAVANGLNVMIFPPASGTPLKYHSKSFEHYAYLNYDKSGNLYVDGQGAHGAFELAELPAGGTSLKDISISGLPPGEDPAAGLAWDGQDVVVADRLSKELYRIAISGSTGTIIDTWHIAGWTRRYAVAFIIDGKQLFFPRDDEVAFFSYPPGKRPKGGFTGRVGNVLSLAPEVIN